MNNSLQYQQFVCLQLIFKFRLLLLRKNINMIFQVQISVLNLPSSRSIGKKTFASHLFQKFTKQILIQSVRVQSNKPSWFSISFFFTFPQFLFKKPKLCDIKRSATFISNGKGWIPKHYYTTQYTTS